MRSGSSASVCPLSTHGILAALIAPLVLAGTASLVPETATHVAVAAEGPPEEWFDDPEAIKSRFDV